MRLIPLFLVLLMLVQPASAAVGESVINTLDNMKDTIGSFFSNIINAVKNGISNVVTAIKSMISSLIPDIPSLTDIKNYVMGFFPNIPSMSDIWTYIKGKIDSTYNFVGESWTSMKSKVDDAINRYIIDKVFEPLFSWVDYDWNYSRSISINVYYGLKATVVYFVNSIPGVSWLNDNIDKLKRLIP